MHPTIRRMAPYQTHVHASMTQLARAHNSNKLNIGHVRLTLTTIITIATDRSAWSSPRVMISLHSSSRARSCGTAGGHMSPPPSCPSATWTACGRAHRRRTHARCVRQTRTSTCHQYTCNPPVSPVHPARPTPHLSLVAQILEFRLRREPEQRSHTQWQARSSWRLQRLLQHPHGGRGGGGG